MQVTLDKIITNWLIHNKLDHIFCVMETDIYGESSFYKALVFKDGIFPSYIGFIINDKISWLSDICNPYDWPTCWKPNVGSLNAYNPKFFEELEEVLMKSYKKHKNDILKHNG